MLLKFSNWLAFEIFKLAEGSRIGEALSFFIYDTIKILLLLFVMIFIIGVLRSYLPQNKLKIWLNKKGIKANFFAALFGAVTPFCSCSSIPIFIGMVGAGIPLGIVFTFLIVSPLINEYLVVLMVGSFGWKISILYVISGMLIGIVSGVIMGKLKLEKYLNNDLFSDQNNAENNVISYPNFNSRLKYGYIEAISITKKIWYLVLIG
ncbi:MAG: permease, partial [Candidatus Firestonebacteria bacterium]